MSFGAITEGTPVGVLAPSGTRRRRTCKDETRHIFRIGSKECKKRTPHSRIESRDPKVDRGGGRTRRSVGYQVMSPPAVFF